MERLAEYEDSGLEPAEVLQLKKNSEEDRWVPVLEQLPEPEKLVMLSFSNFSLPMIGRYTEDAADDGTFRVGDADEGFAEHDLYVNAWMPLPNPYRED